MKLKDSLNEIPRTGRIGKRANVWMEAHKFIAGS